MDREHPNSIQVPYVVCVQRAQKLRTFYNSSGNLLCSYLHHAWSVCSAGGGCHVICVRVFKKWLEHIEYDKTLEIL